MNFYKRHIGDYLKDTAHLTLLEHGVYTRLLDVYYTRESGIPDDQAARLIGARGRDEVAALKVVLSEFFELVDGTWIQDRCEREIRATVATEDDGDAKPAKSGKALRQQAYRERRAALFEALRERGVTMPFKATMDELQDALLFVTKTQDVTSRVTSRVTDDEHNVTATISHKPDSISHKPDLKPSGTNDADGTPPASDEKSLAVAVEISKSLREWDRARGKFPRNITPSQEQVIELAALEPTPDELRKAYELAVEARDNANDPSPINAAFVRSKLEQLRRPPPKKREPSIPLHAMTDKQLDALCVELGIRPSIAGESRDVFLARIREKQTEIRGRAA